MDYYERKEIKNNELVDVWWYIIKLCAIGIIGHYIIVLLGG